jgi:hypothetical protein
VPITGAGRIDDDIQRTMRAFLPQGRFGERRAADVAKTDKQDRRTHKYDLYIAEQMIRSATANKYAAGNPAAACSGRIGLQIIRSGMHYKSGAVSIEQGIVTVAERRSGDHRLQRTRAIPANVQIEEIAGMCALRIVKAMLLGSRVPVAASGFEIGTFAFAGLMNMHAMTIRPFSPWATITSPYCV